MISVAKLEWDQVRLFYDAYDFFIYRRGKRI